MGSDGLVDLDQETWVVLAKYNLALATLLGVLAVLFGAVQTYAWLSS